MMNWSTRPAGGHVRIGKSNRRCRRTTMPRRRTTSLRHSDKCQLRSEEDRLVVICARNYRNASAQKRATVWRCRSLARSLDRSPNCRAPPQLRDVESFPKVPTWTSPSGCSASTATVKPCLLPSPRNARTPVAPSARTCSVVRLTQTIYRTRTEFT